MKKYKIEFLYDKKKDITNIFSWLGMQLKDSRTVPGSLTKEEQDKLSKKITKELSNE